MRPRIIAAERINATKTERITILGTPDFKAYLNQEAKREGISVSQLVRQRCEKRAVDKDEEMLRLFIEELRSHDRRLVRLETIV